MSSENQSNAVKIFHERLRELIKQKGLEQKELAEKMNLSITTVNGWFRPTAENVPPFPRLCELADILSVSLDYLAGRTDEPRVRKPKKAPLDGSE